MTNRSGQDRVESTEAIGSENLGLGWKVLHRKTKGVKFDRNTIVGSEFTNWHKIFDNVGSN
jgi:hypothetical protein